MPVYNVINYNQNETECYTTVMPFEDIYRLSKVLIYQSKCISEECMYGYQRKVNTYHVRKIRIALLKNEIVSPTSIVLGVSPNDFSKIYVNGRICTDNFKEKIFRIIDGQHRLEGIRLASKDDNSFNDYQLNIIIMVINENNRFLEVQVFNNINAKARRVKTDLTILAKHRYDILLNSPDVDVHKYISTNAIFLINDDEYNNNSMWANGVKLDIENDKPFGIMGFTSFLEAIAEVSKVFPLSKAVKINNNKGIERLKEYDKISGQLANYIIDFWQIIYDKWDGCFKKKFDISLFEEKTFYFSKNYLIQKTVAVKAFHKIVRDLIQEFGFENSLVEFKVLIKSSSLSVFDWSNKGIFAGFSSESAVRVMVEKLKENYIKKG